MDLSTRLSALVANPSVSTSGGHVEYEVKCKATEKHSVVQWSVWKRFRDFEALDQALRAHYGPVLMEGVSLPAKAWMINTDPSFVATRRAALERYLGSVLVFFPYLGLLKSALAVEAREGTSLRTGGTILAAFYGINGNDRDVTSKFA